jgi:hypothetical protein
MRGPNRGTQNRGNAGPPSVSLSLRGPKRRSNPDLAAGLDCFASLAMTTYNILPAARSASGFCRPPSTKKFAALANKTREAERRKAHQPWPRNTGKRRRLPMPGAAAGLSAPARLPAPRHGSCQSERTLRLSPGRASRDRQVTRALPAPPIALKRGTPRAGRNAGGIDARTARERGYKPRPQEPHSLRNQVCLEITSLTSEICSSRI